MVKHMMYGILILTVVAVVVYQTVNKENFGMYGYPIQGMPPHDDPSGYYLHQYFNSPQRIRGGMRFCAGGHYFNQKDQQCKAIRP